MVLDSKFIITTVVTISLAFIGYLITYFNNLRLSQRKEKLERVNSQLRELYGPLFALVNTSEIAWKSFRSVYRPSGAYFNGIEQPSEKELEAWRLWMINVFMPTNERMYELILNKSDLLIENEIPQCLLLLCAHVSAYKTVKVRWENNDYSIHTSIINFPASELRNYANKSFKMLKICQNQLLGDENKGLV